MAAGMGDAGNGGPEVLIDEVVDGQRVDIGSQSHGHRPFADFADDAGAFEALR